MNPMQSIVWPGTLIYIHCSFFLVYASEQICLPHHTCPTALLLWSTYRPHITIQTSPKKNPTIFSRYSTYYCQICVRNIYASQMPHIQVSSCADMRHMSVYIHCMSLLQSTSWPQALEYIHFTLLTYAPEQICLSLPICVSNCTNVVLFM